MGVDNHIVAVVLEFDGFLGLKFADYAPDLGRFEGFLAERRLNTRKKCYLCGDYSLQYGFDIVRPIRVTPVLKVEDKHTRLLYFDMMEIN